MDERNKQENVLFYFRKKIIFYGIRKKKLSNELNPEKW